MGGTSTGLPIDGVDKDIARGALITDTYLGWAGWEAVGAEGKQAVTGAGAGEIDAEFGDTSRMMDNHKGVAAAIGVRHDREAYLVVACGREFGHEVGFGRTARSLVVVMISGAKETTVGRAFLPRAVQLCVVVVDRDSWY